MVVGTRGGILAAELFWFRRHSSASSVGGYEVWRECPEQPSAGHLPRGNSPRAPGPRIPRQPHSPVAGPQFILTRLFPPRMGTQPCRHRGAQPTLGTTVENPKHHLHEQQAVETGVPVSPRDHPCLRAGSEYEKQGFRAVAAGGRWGATLGPLKQQAWKLCFELH